MKQALKLSFLIILFAHCRKEEPSTDRRSYTAIQPVLKGMYSSEIGSEFVFHNGFGDTLRTFIHSKDTGIRNAYSKSSGSEPVFFDFEFIHIRLSPNIGTIEDLFIEGNYILESSQSTEARYYTGDCYFYLPTGSYSLPDTFKRMQFSKNQITIQFVEELDSLFLANQYFRNIRTYRLMGNRQLSWAEDFGIIAYSDSSNSWELAEFNLK